MINVEWTAVRQAIIYGEDLSMKKGVKGILKGVLIVVGILLLLIVICIGSFIYIMDYRVAVVDKSLSADKEYELILKSVGEPFLFGYASGRLVLQHNGRAVSKIDFDIADDGGSITPDKWQVSWNPDLVAVRLSGSEQNDELIVMYYNGEISQYVLSTRYGRPFSTVTSEEDQAIEEYAHELFSDEPEIYDGYLAIYKYLTGKETVATAVQYGAKPTDTKLIVSEDDDIVTCLVYDRKSANGNCCLYVYYSCPKGDNGLWTYQNGEIRDIFAYAYGSGEVVSSGKTYWGDCGTSVYQEITGES